MTGSRLGTLCDADSLTMCWALSLLSLAAVLAAHGLSATEPPRPDLAVAGLAAESLCVGLGNQVVVTVLNRAASPVVGEFDVLLTVQLPGRPPAHFRSTVETLDPGARVEVRFVRIEIVAPGQVLFRAEAEPDQMVDDERRADNTAAALVPAAGECGGRTAGPGTALTDAAGDPVRAVWI